MKIPYCKNKNLTLQDGVVRGEHGWHVQSGVVRPWVAHAGQVGHAGGVAGHVPPLGAGRWLVEAVAAVGQVEEAGVGGGGGDGVATVAAGGGASGWLGGQLAVHHVV